jgi:4-amino-4-deoxy-L-arabinose transferase-like glycosyltransferase
MSSAMPEETGRRLAKHYRLILVVILLVAAVLRIHGLNNGSPPGLEHDEVAHFIINRDILDGNHGVYFADAYGHEAGFHYVQTGFMVLLGENALTLRLPSAFAGLLLVAVSFALARGLFGLRTALLAAGLVAVLFWPVFYSRLALRAIALPLTSGLSAYFWWRGWMSQPGDRTIDGEEETAAANQGRNTSLRWFALAGLLAGLSAYTYMAARAVPIFYVLFALYLLLFHRRALRQHLAGIGLFFAIYALVAAPLVIYLLANSGVESRIGEVDAPLRALAGGDLRPALENTLKFMAMFGLRGDPLWRQNVAFLPVFDVVIALFFTIGVLLSLWRWRQARYMFLILWLFTSAIPSILTIDAPSSIRIINVLPILGIFPVIGLEVINFFRPLSTVSTMLSPVLRRNIAIVLILLLSIFNIGRTWRAIFHTWPANDEVQFVWQQALTEAADYLDRSPEDGPVAIGGWTPETMDPPTMELSLKRDDLAPRYFNPGQAVIIANNDLTPPGRSTASRILHPTALPLQPLIRRELAEHGIEPEPMGAFAYYRADGRAMDMFDAVSKETFGQEISLLDYNLLLGPNTLDLVTIWRVDRPTGAERRFFLHLVDESGDIMAQDDGLGAPAAHWRSGDIIIQHHAIELPATPGQFQARLGVYDPSSGLRLLTAGGADFVTVGSSTAP